MHFKCLNNCNWPTCSSPEPKACNMGSFSLIKSSTDTFWRKPHRMERIISPSSATPAACLSSHRHEHNPWGHHHHGAGHGSVTPASPQTLCCEPGGLFPCGSGPPGCPQAWPRAGAIQVAAAQRWLQPRHPSAVTSSCCKELLLAPLGMGRGGGLCDSLLGLGAAPPLPAWGGRR